MFGRIPWQAEAASIPSAQPATPGATEASALAGTDARHPIPWRRVITTSASLWLVTRLAMVVITYFSLVFIHAFETSTFVPIPPDTLLQSWQREDVIWYLTIAQHGYTLPQQTAFFPLYPLIVGAITTVTHLPVLVVAMLVGNLGTLLAFIGLGLLAAQEFGEAASAPTLRVFAAYPLAVFLFMGYADGLMFAFFALGFFFARRGAWRGAMICEALAAITRPTSVLLILPLAWEFGRQHGWWRQPWWTLSWWREGRWRAAFRGSRWRAALQSAWRYDALAFLGVIATIPLLLGLYALFCWARFGDPLSFANAQYSYFLREHVGPLTGIKLIVTTPVRFPFTQFITARILVDMLPLLLFGLLTIVSFRRVPVLYTIFMVGLLYLATATPTIHQENPWTAVGRYMLAAVPMFLLLGQWARRYAWVDTLIVSVGFMLQAFIVLYVLIGGKLA